MNKFHTSSEFNEGLQFRILLHLSYWLKITANLYITSIVNYQQINTGMVKHATHLQRMWPKANSNSSLQCMNKMDWEKSQLQLFELDTWD